MLQTMLQTMLDLLLCFAPLLSGKILCCKPKLCFQSLDSLKRHLTRQARLIPERANAGASSKESSKNKGELCGSTVPVFFRFLRRRKMPKAPHGLALSWDMKVAWAPLLLHMTKEATIGRQLHLPLHSRRERFRPSTLRTTGA
jgi:hypothetical protein